MLFLVALPVISAVAMLWRYLQIHAPSNALIRRVRSAPPRWHTVLILSTVAAGLFIAMHVVSQAVEGGAPGWLNLVVLMLAWDAIKVGLLTVVTALRAITVRVRMLVRHRSAQGLLTS